ncbi:MAG TPA: futalosine hydrolase [Phycisphaerales bacterium]|nr:futalosine hydrolase [Phycisphaerales bacterium]
MKALLRDILAGKDLVLGVAAPVEVRAILDALGSDAPVPGLWEAARACEGVTVLRVGVSKALAAGAIARSYDPACHGAVVSAGIAGSLPGKTGGFPLRVRDVVVADRCVFGDEGIVTDDGYRTLREMGFAMDESCDDVFPCDERLVRVFEGAGARVGTLAAVSICSGTDAIARDVTRRTGALAEAMEGAAMAVVCRRLQAPFCEVRAISNRTGARAAQGWDIRGALHALGSVLGRALRADG